MADTDTTPEAPAPAPREPRKYIDPYLGGALLGVVLFLAFYVTGGGLGASAGINHVQVGLLDLVAPGHVDRVAYLAEMAGGHRNPWAHSSIYMLVGTLLGSMYSLMQFLFVPVWGRVSDRVGRRPVLLWSVFTTAIGMLALGTFLDKPKPPVPPRPRVITELPYVRSNSAYEPIIARMSAGSTDR